AVGTVVARMSRAADMSLAVAGMGVVVTGTAVAGLAEAVAGITVVTVAAGELAPRSVSVLALDSSEEHQRPLPIMVAIITATIMRRMPVHPRQRFGIGAMPIKLTTPRYPSAPFRGEKLFS